MHCHIAISVPSTPLPSLTMCTHPWRGHSLRLKYTLKYICCSHDAEIAAPIQRFCGILLENLISKLINKFESVELEYILTKQPFFPENGVSDLQTCSLRNMFLT